MQLCGFQAGLNHPLFLIAGPCVIESRQHAIAMGRTLKKLRDALKINLVYKSSFDKANRGRARRVPTQQVGAKRSERLLCRGAAPSNQ